MGWWVFETDARGLSCTHTHHPSRSFYFTCAGNKLQNSTKQTCHQKDSYECWFLVTLTGLCMKPHPPQLLQHTFSRSCSAPPPPPPPCRQVTKGHTDGFFFFIYFTVFWTAEGLAELWLDDLPPLWHSNRRDLRSAEFKREVGVGQRWKSPPPPPSPPHGVWQGEQKAGGRRRGGALLVLTPPEATTLKAKGESDRVGWVGGSVGWGATALASSTLHPPLLTLSLKFKTLAGQRRGGGERGTWEGDWRRWRGGAHLV